VGSLKNVFFAIALDDIADGRNSVFRAILDMPHLDAVKRLQQSAQREWWACLCHASSPAEGKVTTNGRARYSAGKEDADKWFSCTARLG
jgi:hypothetical protein